MGQGLWRAAVGSGLCQGLTSASVQSSREACRSPLHQAAAYSTSATPKFSGFSVLSFLTSKSEIETAAEHSKIVPWAVDNAKTQVVSPTDVPRESDFETGSELREYFGLAAEVLGLRIH
jgi:hypothetical protein